MPDPRTARGLRASTLGCVTFVTDPPCGIVA
jgi:hypothetical protein